jgi:hypothetical protein
MPSDQRRFGGWWHSHSWLCALDRAGRSACATKAGVLSTKRRTRKGYTLLRMLPSRRKLVGL